MTTTQRPAAAVFSVREFRQSLLVLCGVPDVVARAGVIVPTSMSVTYRRQPEGVWVPQDITLIGHLRDQPDKTVHHEMYAAGGLGPSWVRELAIAHRPVP